MFEIKPDNLSDNEILEELYLLDRYRDGIYFPIKIGIFNLYIYASGSFVYCRPEEDLNSVKDYFDVEIIILPHLELFKSLKWYLYYDGIKGLSGKNVPVNLLPTIIKDLDRLSKLKVFI